MEHHNITDTGTSITLIVVTILFKILTVIIASTVIAFLTIASLLITIVYHVFGVWEIYINYKKNKKEKK
mgnify:CR=1 FL=1